MRSPIVAILTTAWLALAGPAGANIYTVTSPADSGPGTLREAITNANLHVGDDSIEFDLPAGTTIQPKSQLPDISDSLHLDGTSQPGWNGKPIVELDGSLAGPAANGLRITAGPTTVRGLVVNRFAINGIEVLSASSVFINGNYIGTDVSGSTALGNGSNGIKLNQSSGGMVGGPLPAQRNVISGNGSNGILISGGGLLQILGNYIGTNADGSAAIGNAQVGVRAIAPLVAIGGPGKGNLISGNLNGVSLEGPSGLVQGNTIGLDATGSTAIANQQIGIYVGAADCTIGGTTAGTGNVISGNGGAGVYVSPAGTGVTILSNLVGTKADGSVAVSNTGTGVRVLASSCFVGSDQAGTGNLISGNAVGLSLEGDGCFVGGNLIGLNALGTSAIGNTQGGINVSGSNNTIGSSNPNARNVISGNPGVGIFAGPAAAGTKVIGNRVGTTADGLGKLGNGATGVRILGSNCQIGGTAAGEGNVVSGNTYGISLEGDGCKVAGNIVGLDRNGSGAIPNSAYGIDVAGDDNQVGDASAVNVFSSNGKGGIFLGGNGNTIAGNRVGTDLAGSAARGNGGVGIRIDGTQNTVGDSGAHNVVSANVRGIYLNAAGNVLQANIVGLNAAQTAKLPNTQEGIYVAKGGSVIGGPGASLGNAVAGNDGFGIYLSGPGSSGTVLQGNFIGASSVGGTFGNFQGGVYIYDSFDNTIGGLDPGDGNTIRGNGWVGIGVGGGTHNAFLGNRIYGNQAAGIELQPPLGPSINDPGDADFGSNQQQNYPVLKSALVANGHVTIAGRLDSAPKQTYRVEFFAGLTCDPSGMGEGENFLGSVEVTTDATGFATINASPASSATNYITATATSADGDTSEFAPCVLASGASLPGKFQFATDLFLAYEELGKVTITVTRSDGSTGAASVNYTTVDDVATSPADFAATAGTLTFADGEVIKTFDVPLVLDASGEGQQNFTVKLSSPTGGATLGSQSQSTVALFDYDPAFPGTFVSDAKLAEGDAGTSNMDFTVTVTPTNVPVVVDLKTVDGTAKAAEDYTAQSFQLTFQPGDAPKIVHVPVMGDTVQEGDEFFFLTITHVSLGYVSGFGQGVILDDDAPAATPLCVGGTTIGTPRLVISNLGGAAGEQVMTLTGKLVFPAGTPAGYTPLDAVSRGAQIRIEDVAGAKMLLDLSKDTASIPAGAASDPCVAGQSDGWNANPAQTVYTYRNHSGGLAPACTPGSAGGLGLLRLVDRRAAVGKVKLRARSKGTFAAPTGDVHATIVLAADATAGLAGACAEHSFTAPQCTLNAAGTRVVCK